MQESAGLVFEQWKQDVAKIQNERLRQRSEARLAVARERYDAIAKVAVPTQTHLDGYVKTLRDHATFLAHDLNTSALDEIQSEVVVVGRLAESLDRSLDACLAAARTYVERAALPAAPPAQPAR
jgi:signal transduction histidine kinase